jgi:hypothetical protein
MRVVLRSLDGLQVTFVDPELGDNDPPVEAYGLPMPAHPQAYRYYDFQGSRRDEDADNEVVRVYVERIHDPRTPKLRLLRMDAERGVEVVAEVVGSRHVLTKG